MEQRERQDSTGRRSFYGRWSALSSLAACAVALLAIAGRNRIVVTPAIGALGAAGFGLVALTALYIGSARLRERSRPADFVTGLRALAAGGTLAWLAFYDAAGAAVSPRGHWGVLLVLAAAETSDLFDGYLARRFGATRFGALWDMENDAYFIFALSVMVYLWFGVGAWILIVGVFRYAYVLAFRFVEEPVHVPASYKTFAKWVCAYLAIALVAMSAPILQQPIKVLLGVVAVLLQTVSFGWDLRLQLMPANRGGQG